MTTTETTTARGTRLTTTTETVAQFRSRQVVFPTWMQEAVAGLDDSAEVVVVREEAGFAGTFVLSVSPA